MPDEKVNSNKKLITMLIAGAIGMFGFGFALVPLYDVLCEQLGINGKTSSTASSYKPMIIDTSRTVTIEFMAQIQSDMPWEFKPEMKRMQVHPGELIRTNFKAVNLSSEEILGQAIPSVSPGQGAAYFNKTECFCFNQQRLTAEASAELPLIFFVDPDLPESISTLTLSYTLYNITNRGYVDDVEQGATR
ncbi:cytochrome c oxidase assembly protein [Shewanella sp. D64]|uniref:cytochrome c oxidase assembly protein n=1 Tax=unclassified Shewanella TaxID=196818 RepID=UPI0022BA3793|nr:MULTISPECIES: cytochrome c oxidase assembly protein [unclassified Shewanella]MEC4727952.1 cytochrome c oxidase assembly protein [Shewanella sp. D64]MEC4740076.1 cytochrome c oxidase assembly protein [Shewanella sp. E94]WBJ95845.1 cytochrome c oxidase assembly protein [Shewanella sp. MTB7]